MRRINSEFQTKYLSEEGKKLLNRDYFGFVEMEDYACYCLADSLDEDMEENSAKYVVESLIRSFLERPTMGKGALKRYVMRAHYELTKHRRGMRLKASVVIAVTDYKKVRSCHVGNSRFYLIRNGDYYMKTKDQSLTQNLIEEERLSLDKAMLHEERNNLYSYLGERGKPLVQISKKISLENGDIFAQLTRGIWEICSDEELMQAVDHAKEPENILNSVEDLILGRQEDVKDIDNYSLAVTSVRRVYQNPKKKLSTWKALLVVLPILMVVVGISLGLYFQQHNKQNKESQLAQLLISAEEYFRYDNHKKASEDYMEAKRLAIELKQEKKILEADQYLKIAEQIILADKALLAGEYVKAQELYLVAKEVSIKAGNSGKKYIDLQLEQIKERFEIYDWMSVGEIKEEYGDLKGAIHAYGQAREKASAMYDKEAKEEAMRKQANAEQKLAEEKKANEESSE